MYPRAQRETNGVTVLIVTITKKITEKNLKQFKNYELLSTAKSLVKL